jgi:hypothetical protein
MPVLHHEVCATVAAADLLLYAYMTAVCLVSKTLVLAAPWLKLLVLAELLPSYCCC